MTEKTGPNKRILRIVSIDSRRSCNAFVFQDMITGERIEITGKGLRNLLEDIGVIGMELDQGRRHPSTTKPPTNGVYYTVLDTSLGDKEHGQRQIISTRSSRRSDRD